MMNPSLIFFWMMHRLAENEGDMATVVHRRRQRQTGEDSIGMTNCWGKDNGEHSKYDLSIGSDMTLHFRMYLEILKISHKKYSKYVFIKQVQT